VLGRSGFVGWCGIELVARVRPGDTVLVSAAGGAVGMVAGQLARDRGARVVGIAGGEKAGFVVDELRFDACIDRHAQDVGTELDRLCPDGVDVYFDNVGGQVLNAVFDRLADFGRVVVCGMAGEYNAAESSAGPPLRPVLRKRLRIEGFVVYDHYDRYPEYRAEALAGLGAGRLRYREDVVPGLENAPAALARLLRGENHGKQLVQLGPEPHRTDERTGTR
jgi:NADPH-dependent curcumin reductase CurA